MHSPLPPDPYSALGVPKDADLGQIRTAHRKLVLKFHPDRIKGDNTEEKDRAKNEFQRVQQAYELLADSSKRARYDDQVKLAELQKQKMMRDATSRPRFQSTQTAPAPFVRREVRKDGAAFMEERAPPTGYFDDRDLFDDQLPRGTARKHEAPYEKERKPSPPKPMEKEKEKKSSSRSTNPMEALRTAAALKAGSVRAKERVREGNAKSQETRDRERTRERSEKHSGRHHAYAEDESETDSDSTPRQAPRPGRESPRRRQASDPVRSYFPSSRSRPQDHDDDSHDEGEKWERHFKSSRDYIAESKNRPHLPRHDSDTASFWAGDVRQSGSDSEGRASRSRRSRPHEARPPPAMPGHKSAPASHMKAFVEERIPSRSKNPSPSDREQPYVEERMPPRSKTNPYPTDREQRPMPNLNRSQTMPTNKSAKPDTVPTRGSKLKHSETQDSGYYSSSNPHTPEMKGDSPMPSRENSKKKGGPVKYQIVTPESDDERASHVGKILESDDDGRSRRYRSPERDMPRERERDRDRDRDRAKDRDRAREKERPVRQDSGRSRTTRETAPTSYTRGEFVRHDSGTSRASAPGSSRPPLFGEVRQSSSDEKEGYSYRHDAKFVNTANYQQPSQTTYERPRFNRPEDDYAPGSTFREPLRYSRRPSVAHAH